MKQLYVLIFTFIGANVIAQNITFSDINFKQKLTQQFGAYCRDQAGNAVVVDQNQDGEISEQEALVVYQMVMESVNINNVDGIEHFINLERVQFKMNRIPSFDATTLPNLKYVDLYLNGLTSVSISNLANLEFLDVSANNLTTLDLSNLPRLSNLKCNDNRITNLAIQDKPLLLSAMVSGFSIDNPSTLTVTNTPLLQELYCNAAKITDITLSGIDSLRIFEGKLNLFTSLDFSMMTNAESIQVVNNYQLNYLNVKNGRSENVYFGVNIGTSAMEYVCADEEQLSDIQYSINIAGIGANCGTSPYCSFQPGGNFTRITGTQRWDANNNGCSTTDPVFGEFKLHTTNANGITYDVIPNSTGNYQLDLPTGNYTIQPVLLENSNLFTISPNQFTVVAGTDSQQLQQDFCVQALQNVHDVAVEFVSISDPRPGFDVQYLIKIRNIGTLTSSGQIRLTFPDEIVDFVSSSINTSSTSSNQLFWNYSDLLPFQSFQIFVTFNVNSPAETPAVNIGDILDFHAAILTNETDDVIANNFVHLPDEVVGAYDPNDMTCLTGETIGISQVGDFLYYRVRFENTGNYPAEFVVIRNPLDLMYFDINSLKVVSSSHELTTAVHHDSFAATVEFLYPNINLGFADDENDGYVIYKIKTKANLGLGSQIPNNASIYFDYNLPIHTNDFTTTVVALNTNDFGSASGIKIYPNPANETISISSLQENINELSIYNLLGQQVLEYKNPASTIDISQLNSGTYFVWTKTNKGKSVFKLIKN